MAPVGERGAGSGSGCGPGEEPRKGELGTPAGCGGTAVFQSGKGGRDGAASQPGMVARPLPSLGMVAGMNPGWWHLAMTEVPVGGLRHLQEEPQKGELGTLRG